MAYPEFHFVKIIVKQILLKQYVNISSNGFATDEDMGFKVCNLVGI